jgi:hypothetical protein
MSSKITHIERMLAHLRKQQLPANDNNRGKSA